MDLTLAESRRSVSRDDIARGCVDFGVDLAEHNQFVMDAMKPPPSWGSWKARLRNRVPKGSANGRENTQGKRDLASAADSR